MISKRKQGMLAIGLIILMVGVITIPSVQAQLVEGKRLVFHAVDMYFELYNPLKINSGSDFIMLNQSEGITLGGEARVIKSTGVYAYNMFGATGTFNSVACIVSGAASLDRFGYARSFDDGQGGGQCEAAAFTIIIPRDYEAGTDFNITVHWTSANTTGNVEWGIGMRSISEGENYTMAETYQTFTDVAPGTAWYKEVFSVNFSGTGILENDNLQVVVYRDADAGGDTLVGDSVALSSDFVYISNKLGA